VTARPLTVLAALLACLAPDSAEANTINCGGNSHSYAEVVSASRTRPAKDSVSRPKRGRGVVEVMPDSLCADLIERRRPGVDRIEVIVDPNRSEPGQTEPGEAESGRTDPRRRR
jgi:hypothetical protein